MAQKPKTYWAEAVLDLRAQLLLGPEFRGLLKFAEIGGVDVHVVLPDFGPDKGGFSEPVVHPRAKVDWLDFFAQKTSEDDPGWPFGRSDLRVTGDEDVWARRLLVLPKRRLTLREARNLKFAADDWLASLETWIEVLAREDLHQERVKVDHTGRGAYLWVGHGGPSGKLLPGRQRIVVSFGSRLPITPWQWGKMLEKASDGAEAPEAHIFLRDARSALNSGRYRRSVLDAATAAELALAKLRDDELAGSSARVVAYVQKNVSQISRLSELLSPGSRMVPKRIIEDIGKPRNRAIHEGREPSEATADAALAKAEEVVDLAFPRKKLL